MIEEVLPTTPVLVKTEPLDSVDEDPFRHFETMKVDAYDPILHDHPYPTELRGSFHCQNHI